MNSIMHQKSANKIIADMFGRMADILEYSGEDIFKINAYRKAALSLNKLDTSLSILYREKRLRSIPGIGPALEKKIEEYLSTGSMKKYDEIIRSVPPGIAELLQIKHLGPKTLKRLQKEFCIQNPDDLAKAFQNDTTGNVSGLGQKITGQIMQSIQDKQQNEKPLHGNQNDHEEASI